MKHLYTYVYKNEYFVRINNDFSSQLKLNRVVAFWS